MCARCVLARSCRRCRQLLDIETLLDDEGYVMCRCCGSRQLHVGLRLLKEDVGRRPWGLPVTYRVGQQVLIETPDMRGWSGRIEHLEDQGDGTDESPLFLVALVRLFETLPSGSWVPTTGGRKDSRDFEIWHPGLPESLGALADLRRRAAAAELVWRRARGGPT